jgi:hypothetical protein
MNGRYFRSSPRIFFITLSSSNFTIRLTCRDETTFLLSNVVKYVSLKSRIDVLKTVMSFVGRDDLCISSVGV